MSSFPLQLSPSRVEPGEGKNVQFLSLFFCPSAKKGKAIESLNLEGEKS